MGIGLRNAITAALCIVAVCRFCQSANGADRSPEYHIPRVDGVRIDGDDKDWTENGKGFQVNLLISATGELPEDSRFNARMQLGWDERGLLVITKVQDPTPFEVTNERRLFEGDSVEFFMAPAVGDLEHYLLVASPGRMKESSQLRRYFFDKRNNGVPSQTAPPLAAEVARGLTSDGYFIEARIPWSNMKMTPQKGMTFAFQAYVMDGSATGVYTACWYPRADTHLDRTDSMMALTLADYADPPYEETARASLTNISVVATANHLGKPVTAKSDELGVMQGELAKERGYAVSRFKLPASHNSFVANILVDNRPLDPVHIPATDALVYETVELANPEFFQYLFPGPEFPKFGMHKPQVITDAVGKYTLNARFYDSSYHEVEHAEVPGRYAGVLELRPEHGRSVMRFFTLYCAGKDLKVNKLAVPYWITQSSEDILGRVTEPLPTDRNTEALPKSLKIDDVGPRAAKLLAAKNADSDPTIQEVSRVMGPPGAWP